MTGETRTVLLTDTAIETAEIAWSLLKNHRSSMEDMLFTKDRSLAYWTRNAVTCPTCNADVGERCQTRTGRPASSSHNSRYVRLLAVIFAMSEEITISEEPEITDPN